VETYGDAVNSSHEPAASLRSRNFLLYLAGLELNQVAGGLLRFALPLHVLLTTGNPAVMGTVLAVATVPQILLMPLGGVIADRLDKRRFLAAMNLAVAAAVAVWLAVTGSIDVVVAATMLMLVFLGLEALLSPALESVVPALVPEDRLVRANSMLFALGLASSIGSPALGGALLARGGLTLALGVTIALYVLAAGIKWLVRIPNALQDAAGPPVRTAVRDLREAGSYVAVKDRGLRKVLLIDLLVTVALVPLQVVLLPSLLVGAGLSSGQSGWATGITMAGAAIAVSVMGALGSRATVRHIRPIVALGAVVTAATGLAFLADLGPLASAVVLVGGLVLALGCFAAYSVLMWSFMGERAPEHLMGKVFALALALSASGVAAGNWAFGHLTNLLHDSPAVVILIAAGIVTAVAVGANMAAHAPASADTVEEPEKVAVPV